nr:hypothetical protein BaRGS_026167 [Batillaria attramentaria]
MAGYVLFALIEYLVTVTEAHGRHNVMVFLTTWTYIVETTYFVLGAVLATLYFIRPTLLRSSQLGSTGDPENPVHNEQRPRGKDNKGFVAHNPESVNSQEKRVVSFSVGESQTKNGSAQPQNMTVVGLPGKKAGSVNDSESSSVVGGGGGAGRGTRDVEPSAKCTPWYVKMYWVVSNMIQAFAIVVTVIYFTAVFEPKRIPLHDINVHGINSVILFIDVAVCARPVRLLHAIYPVVYGLTYVVWSAIYWSLDNENNVLYKNVLDWNVPGLTVGVILLLGFIGIPLLQLLHFGIFRLRLIIYKQIYDDDYM